MTIRTLIGDVRERLREIPDESVHCVVTSPPYWGLRDYGIAGQLGLEPTIGEHVEVMANLFDEVRRVLRHDGTLWMNYGDSYASSMNGTSANDTKMKGNDDRTFRDKPISTVSSDYKFRSSDRYRNRQTSCFDPILKPKDMCGVPWRVAFALQERGWWLRQDIIWAKPNPMPESIRDRCTKAHEYIFLLAKSERYYFDQEAIAEPSVSPQIWNGASNDYYKASVGSADQAPRRDSQGSVRIKYSSNKHDLDDPAFRTRPDGRAGSFVNRNKRSVWTIATAPYSEAHFATFPPELPELCIKAGTSHKGCCSGCGAPWVRQMEELNPGKHPIVSDSGGIPVLRNLGHDYQRPKTLGWAASCTCNRIRVPCTVLDPFGGAGTTAMVADRLRRHAIQIELNPQYAGLAQARIDDDRGPLLDLMEAP